MNNTYTQKKLMDVYRRLYGHYGPQRWWPAEEPFEVMIGAILTQSTAWTNVEKGIINLKKTRALSPQALREISDNDLAELIHPCGYYNAKTRKLKAFASWFCDRFQDNLAEMCAKDLRGLREDLLKVHGIGEETADSILLYACQKPVFVIDAYTRRIVDRLGLHTDGRKYCHYQALFMDHLPHEEALFNDYHALMVVLGKETCRKNNPLCAECCLQEICKYHEIG
jgi:endonuclease III related protein